MDEKLKSCPFCGGEADEYAEDGYLQIECRKCGARSRKDSDMDAIKAWNQRVK